jgi:hypothetical protein
VRRLTIIAAMALLVTWVPATSLCLAENAGLIASAGCCDDSQSTEFSPCCALGSAAYKLDDHGHTVATTSSAYITTVDSDSDFRSFNERNIKADVSPPEVRSSWQFCIRAAANPRAPSSAS